MSVRVQAPGLLTTLQGLPLFGQPHPPGEAAHGEASFGGPMDEVSHRLACLLVGDPPETASLEITLAGPELLFQADALIALTGADLSAEADGLPVPMWRPVLVRAGTCLQFGKALDGCRAYLAVAGGFLPTGPDAPEVLVPDIAGSSGHALRAGDVLASQPPPIDRYPGLQRRFQREDRPLLSLGWFLPWFQELDFRRPASLRLVLGPHWPELEAQARKDFLGEVFRVASDSDRMGIRLRGPRLALSRPLGPVAAPAAPGALLLHSDGAPVLLMAEGPALSSAPRLGALAPVDHARAAQLRPGDPCRFRPITQEEAQHLDQERQVRLRTLGCLTAERMAR